MKENKIDRANRLIKIDEEITKIKYLLGKECFRTICTYIIYGCDDRPYSHTTEVELDIDIEIIKKYLTIQLNKLQKEYDKL